MKSKKQKQINILSKCSTQTKKNIFRGRKTHISKKKSRITLKELRGGSGFTNITNANAWHIGLNESNILNKSRYNKALDNNTQLFINNKAWHPNESNILNKSRHNKALDNKAPLFINNKALHPNENQRVFFLSKEKASHLYFFVKCYDKNGDPVYNNLDGSVLEKCLEDLGVQKDIEGMKYVKTSDSTSGNAFTYHYNDKKERIKSKILKLGEICNDHKEKLLYLQNIKNIERYIKAGIFIFDINALFMNNRYNKLTKYLVNIFNKDTIKSILDKYNLTLFFKEIAPEESTLFIPNTFQINDPRYKFDFSKWYILRPINGFGGKDIHYVHTEEDLDAARKFYTENPKDNGIKYGNDVIASEYITNPLLFNSCKCHLRLYYLVFYNKEYKVFNSFYLDTLGRIITACEEFLMDDKKFDKNKHDTHIDKTKADYFYPNDFKIDNITTSDKARFDEGDFNTKVDEMKNKIKLIMSIISQIIITNTNTNLSNNLLYSEDANAYHIFGIDMMIDSDFIPKLIEINFAPGFGHKPKTKQETQSLLSNGIYGWINETILEPLLKPLKAQAQEPEQNTIYDRLLAIRKHPTYIIPYNDLTDKSDYERYINKITLLY